jgi:hypothetical protein
LNTTALRKGAVGKTNLGFGKWFWKVYGGSAAISVDDNDDVSARETGCWSNGSANLSAVEPRPWRIMRVVLCSRKGETMSGGEWTGVFDLEDDMVEVIVGLSVGNLLKSGGTGM